MPTPMPIIATIAVVKSGIEMTLLPSDTSAEATPETEQCRTDREAHRQHRTERDDQDDHRRDQAVDLALGHLELGEQVAAVLDLEAVDRRKTRRRSR